MWADTSVYVCVRLCTHVYLCPSQGVKEMFLTSPTTKRLTPDLVSDYQIAKCFPYGLSISIQIWPQSSSSSHPTPGTQWHAAHKWMTSWLVMFFRDLFQICNDDRAACLLSTQPPICLNEKITYILRVWLDLYSCCQKQDIKEKSQVSRGWVIITENRWPL